MQRRRLLLPGEAIETLGMGPIFMKEHYNEEDVPADIGPASVGSDEACLPEPLPLFKSLAAGEGDLSYRQQKSLAGKHIFYNSL